jgi:enoyl-[acyl-carrier protein] reductase II
VGTRFLASTEMDAPADYKNAIVNARAQDAVKINFADAVLPPLSPGGIRAVPRSLRNAFVDRWNTDPASAIASSEQLRAQLRAAAATGRAHEYLPFAGQSVELIHDIASAGVIIRRLVEEAESALATASRWVTH